MQINVQLQFMEPTNRRNELQSIKNSHIH